MIRKFVASTIIVVAICASGVIAYGNPVIGDTQQGVVNEVAAEVNEEIELISPQININGEVLSSKNLLISVRVLTGDQVFLDVYKVLQDKEEAMITDHEIIPSENFKTYSLEIKDIIPGDYKLAFKKKDATEPFKTIFFKLKELTVPKLIEKKLTEFLLGE